MNWVSGNSVGIDLCSSAFGRFFSKISGWKYNVSMTLFGLRWIFIFFLFVSCLFAWTNLLWQANNDLAVYFLDVGQGDAILIRAPTGRTILIDGGPGKNILSETATVLPFAVRSLDLIMESHPDSDHVAGLPDVLQRYEVRGVIKPCIGSDNSYDQALDRIAQEKSVKNICALAGQQIDLGGGAVMEIIHAGSEEGADTNASSIVARLTYGRTSFLFSGDTTEKVERYLEFTAAEKLPANVYKVSHHGSKESNEEGFIKRVDPEISIISVGADNRYGHPHQEVLNALEKQGSIVLRTDQLGTITLESDGDKVSVSY